MSRRTPDVPPIRRPAFQQDGTMIAPAAVKFVSYRQYTVLRALLFDGASNKEIAGRLFLSEDTVKTHLRRSYERLGVDDRLEAAVAVWSGSIDVISWDEFRQERHLLADLRKLAGREDPCPNPARHCTLATACPPPSPSSISMPAVT